MTIQEAVTQYLEHKASESSPVTCISYKYQLDRFINYFGAPTDVQTITLKGIDQFKLWLGGKYKPATKAFTLRVLKNFMSFMEDIEMRIIRPRLIKVERLLYSSREAMTPYDLELICSQFKADSFEQQQKRLLIQFLFKTGLRISECVGLDIKDINFRERCILVQTKKSYTEDYVFWDEEANKLIKHVISLRPPEYKNQPSLFISISDNHVYRRLSIRRAQIWFQRATLAVGMTKHITPHTARHGKAHDAKSKGADQMALQRILRHKDPRYVSHYWRLNKEEMKEIYTKYA